MAENKMCFPETWEEFRKQYRIVDTEKVYTNGAEMIPTFRVKQWLDHMESEQNKMEQVAALFGKKLGEEFTAVIYDEVMSCKFSHNGLKIKTPDGWHTSNGGWLSCLLIGEAKIVEVKE